MSQQHPFAIGEDVYERLAQLAGMALVASASGHWLLTVANVREGLLASARRLDAAGEKDAAQRTRAEAALLTAEHPLGPLDQAVEALYPLLTAFVPVRAPATQATPGENHPTRRPARGIEHGPCQLRGPLWQRCLGWQITARSRNRADP